MHQDRFFGHQTGEGWYLTGEMVELIENGVENIVCMQPLLVCQSCNWQGCRIKHLSNSNVVAIDYETGYASEINQLNRIKLMLVAAIIELQAQAQ